MQHGAPSKNQKSQARHWAGQWRRNRGFKPGDRNPAQFGHPKRPRFWHLKWSLTLVQTSGPRSLLSGAVSVFVFLFLRTRMCAKSRICCLRTIVFLVAFDGCQTSCQAYLSFTPVWSFACCHCSLCAEVPHPSLPHETRCTLQAPKHRKPAIGLVNGPRSLLGGAVSFFCFFAEFRLAQAMRETNSIGLLVPIPSISG